MLNELLLIAGDIFLRTGRAVEPDELVQLCGLGPLSRAESGYWMGQRSDPAVEKHNSCLNVLSDVALVNTCQLSSYHVGGSAHLL